jgi:hypothetical protein
MARHFRMNSYELYDKLGMRKKKYKIKPSTEDSEQETQTDISNFNASFYMTEPKTYRTKSAEVVKRSENSPVDFKKQLPRPDFMIRALPVHEKRFESYNDNPPQSSRHRTVNTPRFNLYLGRSDHLVNISLREKDLDYSAIEKNTRKGLVPFSKVTGRRYRTAEKDYIDKHSDLDFSHIDPNVAVPDIARSASRKGDSDLPLFMVNFIDRGDNISLKSLQMNGYMNCDFLPLNSSFGNGIVSKVNYPIPIRGRCPKIVKVLKAKLKMT